MINRIFNFLNRKWFFLLNKNQFKLIASTAVVRRLLRIEGKQNISLHENVIIQKMTWLAAVPLTGATKCHLEIGKGSIIGNFNHIYATGEIIIGENVLTADKVFITDNSHHFENPEIPIMHQGIKQLEKVTIGNGAWLGENVAVLGVCIGKNCVIGANSVVTTAIPDYCVAVGSPARVIKKYNIDLKKWEKV